MKAIAEQLFRNIAEADLREGGDPKSKRPILIRIRRIGQSARKLNELGHTGCRSTNRECASQPHIIAVIEDSVPNEFASQLWIGRGEHLLRPRPPEDRATVRLGIMQIVRDQRECGI